MWGAKEEKRVNCRCHNWCSGVKLAEQKSPQKNPHDSPVKVGTSVAAVSPANVVDLRMKNSEQLRYLHACKVCSKMVYVLWSLMNKRV